MLLVNILYKDDIQFILLYSACQGEISPYRNTLNTFPDAGTPDFRLLPGRPNVDCIYRSMAPVENVFIW